jgi:4-alpha-glucanotransferase
VTDAPPALLELAELYGVMTSYEEQTGGPLRHASTDALLGVLAALGAPVAGLEDVPTAMRERLHAKHGALVEPVVPFWSDDPEATTAAISVRMDESERGRAAQCTLVLESGEAVEWRSMSRSGRIQVPAPVPHGYHRFVMRTRSREATSWVVCAPTRTWEPARRARDLGLFLPLYALETARSWGTADLTDLRALLHWSGQHGVRFVGTLPLVATYLGGGRAPVDPGPYAPVSRLFWNELYVDVERAPGLERAPDAATMLSSPSLRSQIEPLRHGRRVRYAEAMAVKRRVLEEVVRALAPADEPLGGALAEFAERHPEAMRYARFRAAVERLGPSWRSWPAGAVARDVPDGAVDQEAVRYHLYAQWATAAQMVELAEASRWGAGPSALYLDLPLGAHPYGFDVWRFHDQFADGLSGGAPPDPFQEEGQDWGFPPLHPERTREHGHVYLRQCLSHLMRASGMLRLDHVMSLHRLYCVPRGHSPLDGAYVRYPADELYAVLCLESSRWRCEVVGEDLGTVPPEVRDAMSTHGLRRMYVVPFQLQVPPPGSQEAPELAPVPSSSVASLGTHDLPPFSAFARGHDIDRRESEGQIGSAEADLRRAERAQWFQALTELTGSKRDATPEEVLPRALRLLAASAARHLLVNIEDLWGETDSQNVPGTFSDENWSLRARHPLEVWADVPGVESTLESLVDERRGEPPDASTDTETRVTSRRKRARGKHGASDRSSAP